MFRAQLDEYGSSFRQVTAFQESDNLELEVFYQLVRDGEVLESEEGEFSLYDSEGEKSSRIPRVERVEDA